MWFVKTTRTFDIVDRLFIRNFLRIIETNLAQTSNKKYHNVLSEKLLEFNSVTWFNGFNHS